MAQCILLMKVQNFVPAAGAHAILVAILAMASN